MFYAAGFKGIYIYIIDMGALIIRIVAWASHRINIDGPYEGTVPLMNHAEIW